MPYAVTPLALTKSLKAAAFLAIPVRARCQKVQGICPSGRCLAEQATSPHRSTPRKPFASPMGAMAADIFVVALRAGAAESFEDRGAHLAHSHYEPTPNLGEYEVARRALPPPSFTAETTHRAPKCTAWVTSCSCRNLESDLRSVQGAKKV